MSKSLEDLTPEEVDALIKSMELIGQEAGIPEVIYFGDFAWLNLSA